ncbi:unnamed protein product [Spirodela intermedia]|uniref:YTH domain-containing family protein n=1 Tax=Spirodela intermedia TaxID=51605 RepID=A0A7I8J6T1_SPIIN|nr:unnamed protein product [Spirodela intermedia]CAA6665730.1 unnamed protein product [Spirodela intermedia]
MATERKPEKLSFAERDDQSYVVGSDGLEFQQPVSCICSIQGLHSCDKISPYHNQVKSVVPYTNSGFSVKENGQSWVGSDKLKTRNKLGIDFLNEQNRGPRTSSHKSASESGSDVAGVFSADDCNGQNTISPDIDIKREDYNLEDFPTKYEHALFFVIKSYSEDDIHKSIKYNVWASTPNGNQRLDNAFQISQAKMGRRAANAPSSYSFRYVNASGQFCGVAEMIGRVNFNKNMDFWQQDKWNGFFPVKWHIIKDVPNSQFRHIILENNDNKPVTNSRDTQEVKFSQGMEVLGIFKAFSSKTSILDDFSFYDNRQKAMQSKRSKAHAPIWRAYRDAAAPVGKAGELDPLIAGLKAVELGPAKSAGEPQMGVEVKE